MLNELGKTMEFRQKNRRIMQRMALGLVAFAYFNAQSLDYAHSQAASHGVIRDTEIETLLKEYAAPIFKAAGINKGSLQIALIDDRTFNAFVTDGRRMFINTGALMEAKTPNEMIGVIAHESGLVAGGHLMLKREQLGNAQMMAVAGMLLGAGAMVAGSGNRNSNSGAGGMGIMLGAQEIATRTLLSYQRGEEQAADRAAIKYLDMTAQSPRGLLDTFKRLSEDMMFKDGHRDHYVRSSPMPQDGIASLETLVDGSTYLSKKDPVDLQARHDLMRAKLYGFVAKQEEVGRKYPISDMSLPAHYARAILNYRYKKIPEALAEIEQLLRAKPENPYFWELKGQVLLEFGRAREAITALKRATSIMPEAGLIHGLLGRALLATGENGNLAEAVKELSNAVQREPEDTETWRYLAMAYGTQGNIGMAEYSAAQEAFLIGDQQSAVNHADKAKKLLPAGSPAALKADDIFNYRPKKL
jgi:predicted Zn-dependent protease